MLESKITVYSKPHVSFFETAAVFSSIAQQFYIPISYVMNDPISLHLCKHLALSLFFLILAILIRM